MKINPGAWEGFNRYLRLYKSCVRLYNISQHHHCNKYKLRHKKTNKYVTTSNIKKSQMYFNRSLDIQNDVIKLIDSFLNV